MLATSAPAAAAEREAADEVLLSGGHAGHSAIWAEEEGSASGLHALFTGRWLETEAAARLAAAALPEAEAGAEAGAELSAATLLVAMATGEDALSEREAAEALGVRGAGTRHAPRRRTVIGPVGSESHTVATKLRLDLIAELGVERACALLRVVTRHGRLRLALRVEGPVVNSEAWQQTPEDELERMLTSKGQVDSPFL